MVGGGNRSNSGFSGLLAILLKNSWISCCRHACVSMPAGASMPSTSVSTSRSRCHCPAANSADGTSCAAFSDVADSVVMPTDESCYDEVVEATDSDVCEFGMSPTKSCQKQAKFAGL